MIEFLFFIKLLKYLIMESSVTDNIQAICAVIGVFISLFGFIYVYKQIKQVNSSIRSNTHNSLTTRSFECSRLLFENIELKKYFYNNVEIVVTDPEYDKVLLFSEIIIDHFQFVVLEKNNIDFQTYNQWQGYMKNLYVNSPILRNYLADNKSTYNPELVAMLENSIPSQP